MIRNTTIYLLSLISYKLEYILYRTSNPKCLTKKVEIMKLIIALFFGITFMMSGLMLLLQRVLNIDFGIIILPQLSPGISAFIMVKIFKSHKLNIVFLPGKIHFTYYLIAVGLPFFVSTVLYVLYSNLITPISITVHDLQQLGFMLFGILIGAFGEEIGWRGYLQKLLHHRMNGFMGSVIVGVLWALWHIWYYEYGVAYMGFFILSTISYSLVLARILYATQYNVLLAFLFHGAVNIGFFPFREVINDLRLMGINSLLWLVIALAFYFWKSKKTHVESS